MARDYPQASYGDQVWPDEVWQRLGALLMTEADNILVHPIDIVLLGANQSFAQDFLTKYASTKNVRVFAVEPQPECIAFLREARRVDDRIFVVPFAVGDFNGPARFYQNAWNVTSSLRMFTGQAFGMGVPREFHEITVEVRRIDTLIEEGLLPARADFIILDVQGSELETIKGGKDFFAKSSTVFAEVTFHELYKGEALYEAVRDELISLGFKADREVTDEEKLHRSWTDILFTK